jgi:hypothetical protein
MSVVRPHPVSAALLARLSSLAIGEFTIDPRQELSDTETVPLAELVRRGVKPQAPRGGQRWSGTATSETQSRPIWSL